MTRIWKGGRGTSLSTGMFLSFVGLLLLVAMGSSVVPAVTTDRRISLVSLMATTPPPSAGAVTSTSTAPASNSPSVSMSSSPGPPPGLEPTVSISNLAPALVLDHESAIYRTVVVRLNQPGSGAEDVSNSTTATPAGGGGTLSVTFVGLNAPAQFRSASVLLRSLSTSSIGPRPYGVEQLLASQPPSPFQSAASMNIFNSTFAIVTFPRVPYYDGGASPEWVEFTLDGSVFSDGQTSNHVSVPVITRRVLDRGEAGDGQNIPWLVFWIAAMIAAAVCDPPALIDTGVLIALAWQPCAHSRLRMLGSESIRLVAPLTIAQPVAPGPAVAGWWISCFLGVSLVFGFRLWSWRRDYAVARLKPSSAAGDIGRHSTRMPESVKKADQGSGTQHLVSRLVGRVANWIHRDKDVTAASAAEDVDDVGTVAQRFLAVPVFDMDSWCRAVPFWLGYRLSAGFVVGGCMFSWKLITAAESVGMVVLGLFTYLACAAPPLVWLVWTHEARVAEARFIDYTWFASSSALSRRFLPSGFWGKETFSRHHGGCMAELGRESLCCIALPHVKALGLSILLGTVPSNGGTCAAQGALVGVWGIASTLFYAAIPLGTFLFSPGPQLFRSTWMSVWSALYEFGVALLGFGMMQQATDRSEMNPDLAYAGMGTASISLAARLGYRVYLTVSEPTWQLAAAVTEDGVPISLRKPEKT